MKQTKPTYNELELKIAALENELKECRTNKKLDLRQIINRIHRPVAVIDHDYRYRFVNKPYCDHFQKNNYEIVGRKADEFIDNDDFNNTIQPHIDKCLQGKELTFEYDFLSLKTKEIIRLELNYYPYYDNNGNAIGVISTAKDITAQSRLKKQWEQSLQVLEQKNNELYQLNEEYKTLNEEYETTIEELKEKNAIISEKEERFRSLFNQGTNGIFVHNFDGNIIEANQKLLDMLQYSYNEIRKLSIFDTHPNAPEVIQAGKKAFEEVKTKGKTIFEIRLIRKNGTEFIAEIHSSIINLNDKKWIQGIVQDISRRKQMEQELIDSEKKYRLLVENQRDLVVHVDNDGKFLFVSPSYCKLFGKKERDLLGKAFIPLVHDEDRIPTENAMKKLYKPPFSAYMEQRALTKDGWRWLGWNDTAVRDSNGNITGIIGVGRDITQRKEAEIALRQSEDKYRTILETISDGFFTLYSKQLKVKYFNRAAEELLGRKADEVLGKPLFEAFPEAQNSIFEEKYRLAYKEKKSLSFEVYFGEKPYQNWYDVRVYASEQALSVFFQVTTERKKAEAAILKEKEKAQQYLDIAGVIFIALNKNGQITLVNQKGCEILGYSQQEMLGKNWFNNFLPPENRLQVRTIFSQLMQKNGDTISYFENLILTKNGERRIIAWNNTILFDDNNKRTGVLCSGEDITERRKAEKTLKEREERFRQLAENIQEVFWISSPDWARIFYISKTYEKVWGFSCQNLYDKPQSWMDSIVAEDKPKVIRDIKKRIAGDFSKKAFDEYRIQRADGVICWIQAKAFPIYNEEGNLYRIAGIAEDITERKMAEDEIRKFKTISNRAVHGNAIVDLTGRIIYINKAFASVHGYTPDELLGRNLSLFHTRQQMEYVKKINKALIDEGYYNAKEVWHIHKNGTKFPMLMSGVLIRDHKDKPVYMAASAIDLTKLKRAEKELRISENRFRSITENAVDFIFIKNKQREYTFVNKAMQNLLGVPKEQIIGKKPHDVFGKEQQPVIDDIDNRTFSGQTVNETRRLRIAGREFFFNTIQTPLTTSNNEVTAIMGIVRDITDYKQAEKALKESEERFKLAMQATHDGLWDWNLITEEIYFSPGWKRMLGYHDHELENKLSVWKSLTHPEDVQKALQLLDEHINGKRNRFEFELRMRHKDGYWIDVLTRANAIVDQNKKPVRVVGTHIDISQRKKAEAEIIKTRNLLIQTGRMARVGGWEKNLITGEDNWSEITREIHEVDPDFKPDMQTGIHFYKEGKSRQKIKQVVGRAIETGEPFDVELQIVTAKGNERWIRAIGSTEFKDGKCVRLYGTFQDIDEKKRAEEALRKSEERYRFVTENIEEFIFMISSEGDLTFASGNVDKVFNISYKQLVDKNIKTLMQFFNISNEQQETIFKQFSQALQRRQNTVDYEFYYYLNDRIQYFYCFEKLIYNQQGRYEGAIGVIRDITDRKNAEIELKNKNEEYLAVNEELRQINEELKKAKEKAEEGDRLKSAFLANMSHEIRTPMNGIIGFSEMLTEPGLTDARRKYYAEIVQNSSQRLLTIVNNILDISKIETGQMEVDISETIVNDVITETFIFFKAEAINKNISIYPKKSLPQKQSIIQTDEGKLRQILNNLMNNALKYTTQGYIEFGYTLKNGELEFYVKDTGIGIEPDFHQNIFERFRQGKKQSNKLNSGTGLGLSICKSLVILLGGKIWLHSVPDKGATFYFTIPYNPVYPSIENTNAQNLETETHSPKFTILIAEDEEINYLYLEELLATEQFKILHAKNGREAIKIFEQNPDIDLVFMDIKMPIMNGYEATLLIKKKNPEIPVIAQTAYAFPTDKEKALKTGCDDYIAKPIKKKELYRIIGKYLKNN